MNIKLNRKIGKVNAFVFTLCGFNIKSLTYLFLGLALGEQFISAGIEYLIYGEMFKHWFDSAFLIVISGTYFYFAYELGDFLLDLIMNAEVTKDD